MNPTIVAVILVAVIIASGFWDLTSQSWGI